MRSIWQITKFEVKQQSKSLLFLICTILLIYNMYQEFRPLLTYYPIQSDSDISQLAQSGNPEHLQVLRSEKELALAVSKYLLDLSPEYFENNLEASKKLRRLGEEIQKKQMNISQILAYSKENLNDWFYWVEGAIESEKYRFGTVEEVNEKLKKDLDGKYFTYEVAMRFVDRAQVFSSIIVIPLFVLMFYKDRRYQMEELIHSKKIKPHEYIIGRFSGGMLPLVAVLFLLATIINIWMCIKFIKVGETVNFLDMYINFFLFLLPSILFSSVFVVFLSLVFRNSIAALPVLFMYFIFNISEQAFTGREMNTVSMYKFMIRTDGLIIDYKLFSIIVENRLLYLLMSLVFLALSAKLWRKRSISAAKG
ncbi:hypothetical protein KDC22_07060 [Paenibacillus tritici]|uniref:hypothetical protein n=1 Tax=Paenibacillus tritici TaxID=1873425 RepID=UPI001BA7592C|nr:hypothetical protein [Paenibacillus tritici]QUL56263.1 hypothetical protein KDC22_07060 [Paenibacillus tritici]